MIYTWDSAGSKSSGEWLFNLLIDRLKYDLCMIFLPTWQIFMSTCHLLRCLKQKHEHVKFVASGYHHIFLTIWHKKLTTHLPSSWIFCYLIISKKYSTNNYVNQQREKPFTKNILWAVLNEPSSAADTIDNIHVLYLTVDSVFSVNSVLVGAVFWVKIIIVKCIYFHFKLHIN